MTIRQHISGLNDAWPWYPRSSGTLDDRISYFERGTEHVEIDRRNTTKAVILILRGEGAVRCYSFPHIAPLLLFQSGIEAWLVQTGWSLTACEPEGGHVDHRNGHNGAPSASDQR